MISVKIVILVIVWALFVSAVIQFGQLLRDGGFDKHPTGATALLVVWVSRRRVLLVDPAVPPRAPRGPMSPCASGRGQRPTCAQARDLIDCSHMTVRRACRPGPTEP